MAGIRSITVYEAAVGDGFRLDAEQCIAHGVAVCGGVSLNGRDYPDAVRDRDKQVYENAQVYIDHKVGERMVREWFGELRNPRTRVSDRKTIADHHYPKNSQFTAEYEERATKFPRSLGFSHVAVCQTKRHNGREVIEAITRVESVDLVARPATNAGIAESHRAQPMKLKDYCEAISAKFPAVAGKLATIREMDGDMPADVMPVDAATGPDDPVKAAFSSAMHALIDQFDGGELEGPALIAKLKTLMKAAQKMDGAGEAETETEPPVESESLKKQIATLTRENDELKVQKLFTEAGVTPSGPLAKAVTLLPTDAERKELIESFKRTQSGEKPVSPPRQTKASDKPTDVKTESVDDYRKKLKTAD